METENDVAKAFFEGQEKLNVLATKVSRAGLLRAFNIVSSFPFVGDSVTKLNNVFETELVNTALHLRGMADKFLTMDGMSKEELEKEVVDKVADSVLQSMDLSTTVATAEGADNGSGQE